MLNVNTLPKETERWRINVRRRRRKTKTKTKDENEDERRKRRSKKNRRKLKNVFKTNVLVPKTTVIRKEEGATVDSSAILSPYLLSAGRASSLVRPDRQRSSMETFSVQQESPINYRKCPTNETKRNVKRETWNVKRETPAIFSHLIDSPKQMNTNTRCRMSLRKQTNNTRM
jgi:hypothetical protein